MRGARNGVEQHAVERARPAHLHRARGRAERGDDPRQQPVALLPLGTGDVERDDRPFAVRRAALELDERRLGRDAARARRRPTRARYW
ncbi:MAG: hypothetical protein MZV64_13730 [Ignavibacteriales bacterium]|nr:hypothetical protein [Ignavibacteriales bacterium]